MPETVEFLPRQSLLTFEEIERFVRVAATLGIDKIRLTGGEPLVRRDLPGLVAMLAAIPGIKDVGLTTNGILLAPMARALWDAGLRRINVSLDTLDPARFRELTRRDRVRAGDRGHPRRQGGRLRPGQDQRRRDQGGDRGRRRPAGPVRPRARPGAAVHRVHAARRRRPLGARQGPVRRRDPRPARRAGSARSPRPRPGPAGPGDRLRLRRRRRPGRPDRLGQPAVLHELQPRPPDRRRQAPQLPVRPGRDRRPRPAPRRRAPTPRSPGPSARASPASGKGTRSTPPGSSSPSG